MDQPLGPDIVRDLGLVTRPVRSCDKTGLKPTKKIGIGPGLGLVSFGLGFVGLVLVLRIWSRSNHWQLLPVQFSDQLNQTD